MPILRDPVVTLEGVRLLMVSLSSLDLEVRLRVENPNPLGITLQELPFTVLCSSGSADYQLACGNTGPVKIARKGTTVLCLPVTSQNATFINTLATFVTKGGVQVTIRGTATIDCILFGWSIPFSKTLPVDRKSVV
jgi:LEA14-like dessication related protein